MRETIRSAEDFTKNWNNDTELIGVHIPLASTFLSDNSPGLIQYTFQSDSINDQAMNVLCLGQDCKATVIETNPETCLVPILDGNSLLDSNQILEIGINSGGNVFLEEKGRVDLYLQQPCNSGYPIWRLVFINFKGTIVLE